MTSPRILHACITLAFLAGASLLAQDAEAPPPAALPGEAQKAEKPEKAEKAQKPEGVQPGKAEERKPRERKPKEPVAPPAEEPKAPAKPAEPTPGEKARREADELVAGKGPKELVPLLGHARYRVRQRAQDQLMELAEEKPDEVKQACYDAYANDPDPEVRMRARAVLVEAVSKSGSPSGRGFVGIGLLLHAYFDTAGQLRFAVKVNQIVPDTPASKAGLAMGDLVVGVDDLDLNQPDADRTFMSHVGRKGPGRDVLLVVERAGERKEFKVTLARRPDSPMEEAEADGEELFRDFLRERRAEAPGAAPDAVP